MINVTNPITCTLASYQRNRRSVTIDKVVSHQGCTRADAIAAAKKLERDGVGKFIKGARTGKSRFVPNIPVSSIRSLLE